MEQALKKDRGGLGVLLLFLAKSLLFCALGVVDEIELPFLPPGGQDED